MKEVKRENSLAVMRPEIAKQWHPTKNGDLTPYDVSYGSEKIVWWQCEKGHEWQTQVCKHRSIKCPICTGRKLLIGFNDLTTTHPELAKQWHPTKNGDLKPTDVIAGSNKKVWWMCEHKHEWQATVGSRVQGAKCPYCSGLKPIVGVNDLATTHPELAKQWHPTKNGDLKPIDISAGSDKKVWWMCEYGHEWQSTVHGRYTKCPFCVGRKLLTGFNDLATTHPELAKQWHPTKNGNLKPTDVTHGSNANVWWMCEHGHEWKTLVTNRVAGRKCPYCNNKKVLIGFNDLATTHPHLAKQWHPTKNGNLKPTDVVAGSAKKVWWMCEHGHEWKTTIAHRKNGRGCPYCLSTGTSLSELIVFYYINKHIKNKVVHRYRKSGIELDIYIPSLKVGIEYDGEYFHRNTKRDIQKDKWCKQNNITLYRIRENKLKPLNSISIEFYCDGKESKSFADAISQVIYKISGKMVSINFEKDSHKFYSMVSTQIKENSISITHPELAKQWHPTKNGDLLPCHVTKGSNRKVWWMCEHGHEWKAVIASRISGNGCPICSGHKVLVGFNDLATVYPELAKQWHPTKNGDLKPTDITYGSGKTIWWMCEHGHEWKATIHNRIVCKTKCPFCDGRKVLTGFNDLATTHPHLAKQWHPTKNGDLKPTDFTYGSNAKIWWMCEHGHEWKTTIHSRVSNKTKCPYCSNNKVLNGFNDIATTHPEIAKLWHPTKNGDLKPTDFTYGSDKKVWWICKCGCEWKRKISYMTSKDGSECPHCGKYRHITNIESLAVKKPEIAKLWHPTKNGDLKPTDVLSSCDEVVWWICEHGHSFQRKVKYMAFQKCNCPICSGKEILVGFNDLATTHPEIAKQWHPTKNGDLKPTDVTYGQQMEVWWICEHGHEWKSSVSYKVRHQECPVCLGRTLFRGINDLATTHPEIAKQWHPTKNGNLKPCDVSFSHSKKVWWMCEHGHEWQIEVGHRVRHNSRCPYCTGLYITIGVNDLATTHPHLVKQWHPTLNGDLKPCDVKAGSEKLVWWINKDGTVTQNRICNKAKSKKSA